MSKRAYSHRRDLLHASSLDAFLGWVHTQGYLFRETPPKAAYEVARFHKYDPSGTNPDIVIYRRLKGDHLTLCEDGVRLVQRWIRFRDGAAA